MPRDWMPTVTFDASSRIATARGYTGQGVSTTNLAGRVLADLINGASTAITALPLVRPGSRDWEPEPVRWLAIRAMQRAFLAIDRADDTGRRRPIGSGLALWLGRH
jgi:hypothetical protein